HEGLLPDAEIGVAALRQRRGAVDRQRARMQVELLDLNLAGYDRAALSGIDPEPAPRRGGALVVDRYRGLDHIAHAIADLQVGARRRGGERRDSGSKGESRGSERHANLSR